MVVKWTKQWTKQMANRLAHQLNDKHLTQSTFSALSVGDAVRHLGRIVIIVNKSEDQALLASLDPKSVRWYYNLEYCPYLGELACAASCELTIGANSRTDGLANQEKVISSGMLHTENGGIGGCPNGVTRHPAFEYCIEQPGWFVPAIDQLRLLCSDPSLLCKYMSLTTKLHGTDWEGAKTLVSSTEYDADNVLALRVEQGKITEIHAQKTQTYRLIPFSVFHM